MRHVGGVERLRESPDLVHLPKERVRGTGLEPDPQALGVGDEEVIADDLDAARLGELSEALEVALVERVLDRDDVELADELLVELDHPVAVPL